MELSTLPPVHSISAPTPLPEPQPTDDQEPAFSSRINPRPPYLHPSATIYPLNEAFLPDFRRIITTLLPVRYPDSLWTKLLTNPDGLWTTHLALWQDDPPGQLPPKVVGGITARLEPVSPDPLPSSSTPTQPSSQQHPNHRPPPPLPPNTDLYDIYISHLALLAPYRRLGIATALLDKVIRAAKRILVEQVAATTTTTTTGNQAAPAPAVRRVYAHVWQANDDALEWYRSRGFEVGELVEGYYRKLSPRGARVVWKAVG